ncbi:MAG: NAD-dependent epimerase/dehydratase family protein [Treponema sp.]|jgi:nucleoside-diphosphate-sugar epimerase|nr:NAD-dependent epimerase/dehydratase family protein [Treponema sp.]
MKKAIITGAGGFIGRALTAELLAHDVEVIALDRAEMDIAKRSPNSDGLHIVECDLSRLLSLNETDRELFVGADVFYHLGWAGSAGDVRADYTIQLRNVQWSLDAMNFARESGCARFVGAGSIMEKESGFVGNAQSVKPGVAYIYGTAKLAAHYMTKSLATRCGIDHVWAMITNAYGVGESSPRFINTTIRKILAEEPLEFTSGTQNYDFVYVNDIAKAFRLLGETGKPFCQYMLGSGGAKPLRQFIEELGQTLAPERPLYFGNVPYTGVNLPLEEFAIDDLVQDTGWSAEVPFAKGVRMTYDWIKRSV